MHVGLIKGGAFAAPRMSAASVMADVGNTCVSGKLSGGSGHVLVSDLSFPINAAKRFGAAEEVEFRPTLRMREVQVRAHMHRCSPEPQSGRLVPPPRAQRTLELRDVPCSVRSPLAWSRAGGSD